jgi:hypothetical protein
MIYPYKITSKDDLVKLCELACKEDFPIYISTDYGQVDARSLLGLFTVIGKEINLVAGDRADVDKFSKFVAKL